MTTRHVSIPIETDGRRYCSNNCQHMRTDAKACLLFEMDLRWDHRRVGHGNIRLGVCRAREILEKP